MKKKIFFGLAAVAVTAVTVIACKRSLDNKFDARGTNAVVYSPCSQQCTIRGTVTLSGVIGSNRQLSCDTLYKLDGKVFVNNGAVLTIAPGTTIQGIKKNTAAEASALVITKGSKIDARGDQTCPIIFTSDQTTPVPGDWGGVVLLGRATVNAGTSGTIEGIALPSVPAGVDITYGGSIDNDNSGVMTYVRIEYAGASIATDNELNGLTLGGVGNLTTLDFIEVYRGNDDAFEFFGGTVNATHLVAFEPDDDAFDFDLGYVGCIQFAVSVLSDDTSTYSANPNGIENDNDATGSNASPRTAPKISNMTVIGLDDRTTAVAKGLLSGAHLRRNSSYVIRNSIFMGFRHGVTFESAGSIADTAKFSCNIVHAFDTVARRVAGQIVSTIPGHINTSNSNATIQLSDPFNVSARDFRPASGSPALSTSPCWVSAPACWDTTPEYIGAFGEFDFWMAGWTRTPTFIPTN